MKRKVIISLLFIVLAFIVYISFYYNSCTEKNKSISCEENGIIFSITTFDGITETRPFVKCFGHTWLSIKNLTDESIKLKEYEIEPGEILTFSIWAITGHYGVVFNLEANFISQFNRYIGRQSISVNIDETKLDIIADYIDLHDNWTPSENCSCWSVKLWNEVVKDEEKLKTPLLIYTPAKIEKAINKFDCIKTDMDFSGSKEIFFFKDGEKTELKLCS